MVKDVLKRFSTLALAALMVLTMLPVMAMAADLSVTTIDGLTASYTEGDYVSWSVSGNEITGDIHGNSGCSSVTAASSTLTLKNNRATAATLSFGYEVTLNGGSVSINGNTVTDTTNGTFVLDQWNAGDSIDITITSVADVNTHTIIVIKNISLYDPTATANVKFLPSGGGTITVDGELISQESVKTNTADHEYSLVATPDEGFRFFGWINSQNKKISSSANAVFHFDKDETVYAKFIDASSPVFEVDGEQFIDLNEASRYAVENTKSTIVLVEDGTLPAGEYSIPQGITLLIPFDADYTLYTDEPDYVKIVETQYAFRTLTIADGATVNVDGAISVSGKCFTSSNTSVCKPTGAYGHIKMLTGSVINVNNGATLYAWGYITGEGNVIAHSGAQVYEFFQIADWRGGTATSNFKDNANKVFPFSQYYVQNIEAPITYKKGASETVRITVTAGGASASAEVTFVGEAGMFQLEEGSSVTKRYDPISDRLIFDIYGSAVLNGIAMENLPVIGSFNSNVYVLPINNNMTMNIHSGSMTLNQDTALLPGSEVVVDGGAELVIGDGVSLYIYDDGTWSTDYVWGSKNPGITQVAYSPSGRGSRGISDATVDVNGTVIVNGFVYTTGIGAKIVSNLGSGRWVQSNNCGTATVTYQASQDGSGNPKYYDIPITPAKLRNAGDTYFETSKIEAGTTVNYYKEYGAWHHHEIVAEIRNARAESCTEDGYSGDTYCKTCDMMIKYGYSIDAHHTLKYHDKAEPTCTATGMEEYWECAECKNLYADEACTKLVKLEDLVIAAKGHTPGKAVKESVVLATCEAAGSYEEVVYCEVCKEELTRVSKTLPAMGHTRGEAVRENVIDSTCADEGSCDEVVYCEVCKKELSREAKVIEKKAHTPVDVAEVPATCTEPGTTAGTKCDVCGTILSGVKEIPANGHTEVIRNAKPATDTEDGYTGDVYCEVCNELLRNGEVIPATHVKITWIINGVKHETVCAKGEIPVYDGETPAKPETSRFTYEFKGWDKEIVAATENAEYTAEFTAIGKNGLCIEGDDTFWIKNGVNIAFPGLIRIADENGHIHYYYFAEDGKAVKNGNYKVNKNNGLPLPEYGFAFDSDGVIVHDEDTSKNGICDGDGSKFYYIDGVKVGEGLIKVGDYYYYARTSSGEIVRNRQYWITKTNELPIQQGIFDFDAEGRMIVTGFIHAFGATYYYDNGVLAKGFTKIGDDYYIFNASSGKMYSNAMMWVPDNEYGITGGMYEFDADGKMIRTGFITTGGYTYYYDNGVLAKGFTKIGDDYYFFNAGSGKMYRDATLWVADNAEYGFVGGMYYFGADGKMVLPDIENGKKSIVTINGKKYLTIDGAYAPTGLYEIDGNCYYVKAAGELAVSETVWVDNKNGLIPAKGDWRAFDAEGKLIHTGFVTGGDGYVYHYTDDVLSLGFTCIDGEYYLFNAGSGKMYRDANMWVGPNDYGIVGGMYYFDANGKMAR